MKRRDALLALSSLGSAGCVPVVVDKPGSISITREKDGEMVTTTREFSTWGEFVDAVEATAKELFEIFVELIRNLVDVPPPGRVKLTDLGEVFAEYQDHEEFDYVRHGTELDATRFEYVQIGVPHYDDFFRTSAETYAYSVQVTGAARALKRQATLALGMKGQRMSVGEAVAHGGATGEFEATQRLMSATTQVLPATIDRTRVAIESAITLATKAPNDITNPKVVLHVPKIVEGIQKAGSMLKESGELFAAVKDDVG